MNAHVNVRICKIYAILCPDTGRPMYVGKTSQRLSDRMRAHMYKAKKGQTPKDEWLRSLSYMPKCLALDQCEVSNSGKLERRWVSRLSRFNLLNAAPAGSGNPGIGRVSWTPEIDSELGRVNDCEIALRLGCDRKTVAHRRLSLGIKACGDRAKNKKPPAMGGWNKKALAADILLRLGKEPDYLLARRAGVSKPVIRRARIEAGINSYAQSTGNTGRIKEGEPHRRWTK